MFLGQPCCICVKEDNFLLKASETDVAGIHLSEKTITPNYHQSPWDEYFS